MHSDFLETVISTTGNDMSNHIDALHKLSDQT